MGKYRQNKILHSSDLYIDDNGMELLGHATSKDTIALYFDELSQWDNQYTRWHWHPQVEFVLAESMVNIVIGEKSLVLEPGEGVFINTGQLHHFQIPENQEYARLYVILFEPEYIASKDSLIYEKYIVPMLENLSLPFILLKNNVLWQATVLNLLKELMLHCQEDKIGIEICLRNLISDAWLYLYQNRNLIQIKQPSKKELQQQEYLKLMVRYVEEHYMNKIKLEEIARAALISKSECLRSFRSYFSVTPIQYLTDYRLKVACQLLRSSDFSVKEIAEKCGFDDAGYFGKLFKQVKGVTPLKYRYSFLPSL